MFLTIIMQAQNRPQPKPGPSPSINIKKPETFSLSNGLKVLVVEDHKLPRVSFNLTIDNTPTAEGNKKGVESLTSSLIGNGSTKTSKDKFNNEIDFLGANINFSNRGASASGLSKYTGRLLELMSEGALYPNFTQEEFDKEKDKLIESLKTQEKSVTAVAGRVENVLAFGKNHPYGEYLTEETINNVKLQDIKDNYNSYFVPEHAYLAIIGDVNPKEVKKLVSKLFGNWTKATAPRLSFSNPKNVQYTQINFVDMPNAVQSELTILNTVELKITDPDFFAVTLANAVYGGDFNGYLNMNLREKHGWTYGAYSSISPDRFSSGKFKINTQVRNSVTDSAVVQTLNELKRIRTEKITEEALNNVKASYVGNFVMNVEKPATVARFALNTIMQDLPEDYYENYIKKINAVTPDDILRVANKYFLADNLKIIITGKGSEVIPGLEKTKIPIFYFDKFGNPTEKPAMKKSTPAGITVKTVFDNYIKAIGGEKAVKAVNSIATIGTASIPQAPAPIKLTSKKDTKGNSLQIIEMDGMGVLSKQVINGKGGYMSAQGQKRELSPEEYSKLKETANTFDELSLINKKDLVLDGIESINGVDAYIIKNGDTNIYYNVTSGLKIMEAKTMEMGDKKMTLTTNFSDYRDVKGIKIPFEIIINQGFDLDFKISEVKINEGVSDSDFE